MTEQEKAKMRKKLVEKALKAVEEGKEPEDLLTDAERKFIEEDLKERQNDRLNERKNQAKYNKWFSLERKNQKYLVVYEIDFTDGTTEKGTINSEVGRNAVPLLSSKVDPRDGETAVESLMIHIARQNNRKGDIANIVILNIIPLDQEHHQFWQQVTISAFTAMATASLVLFGLGAL